MIKRYQDWEIEKLWNVENQTKLWVDLEILIADFWYQEGLIPSEAWNKIKTCKPDWTLLNQIEKKTNHQLAAMVEMMSSQVEKEGKWIHFGLTSNDILDTTQNYLINQSITLILKNIKKFQAILKEKAHHEKRTLCLGRTHGMGAEPITYGYKFALWFDELQNHYQFLKDSQKIINVSKISGPTGMYSVLSPKLNTFVAKNWNMMPISISNQVMPRYRLIHVINIITNLGITLEKIAIEIRNLSRLEINELKEGFANKQKGSSAMPHKQNPILSENICGLMRYLRSISKSFEHTNLLWHERDLTNSSIERIALPDFFHLIIQGLKRSQIVFDNLVLNYFQIEKNLKNSEIAIFSHKVLSELIKSSSLNRNQAYQIVQKSSFLAKQDKISLSQALIKEGILNFISKKQLDQIFDFQSFLKNLDIIWKWVFI